MQERPERSNEEFSALKKKKKKEVNYFQLKGLPPLPVNSTMPKVDFDDSISKQQKNFSRPQSVFPSKVF